MKDNHNKRRPNARGQPDPSAPKRRRGRLPILANLRLDDTLAANAQHPLAATSPEVREANRLKLIACILARIAKRAMKPTG